MHTSTYSKSAHTLQISQLDELPVDSWSAPQWQRLSSYEKHEIEELFSNLILLDLKKKKLSNLLDLFQQSSAILFLASLFPWYGQAWVIWSLFLTLSTCFFLLKKRNKHKNFFTFTQNFFTQHLSKKIIENKLASTHFSVLQQKLHRLHFLEAKLSKRPLCPEDIFSFIFVCLLEAEDKQKNIK